MVLNQELLPPATAEWFGMLVEHSLDLVAVVDRDSRILYANPAAATTFGASLEAILGTHAFSYIHPDDIERWAESHFELVSKPGSSNSDTVRFVSASGPVRTFEVVATNCLDLPVAGIVINGRDITQRIRYIERLETNLDAFVVSMASVVELRDPYTAGHQREVARVAGAIARELRLCDDETKGVVVAATLHDIGKVAIPSEILVKPTALTRTEFELVKGHSEAGFQILVEIPFPWPVPEMVLQHHERLDGSGYPHGLRGDAIMLGARILAVADVFSAMSSHRPYRPALGAEIALAELQRNAGVLYDTEVVDAWVDTFRDGLRRS